MITIKNIYKKFKLYKKNFNYNLNYIILIIKY